MPNTDVSLGNCLMCVIVQQGTGSRVLNYLRESGIRGATAFHGRESISSHILQLLELADVHREIIMIALPARYEKEILNKLVSRFHFDRPKHGIVFTVSLSTVSGSRHFGHEDSRLDESERRSALQLVMMIVDKSKADGLLDHIQEQGYPRGLVINAHGSADKSRKIFKLMLEPEKALLWIITTRNRAQQLADTVAEHLNLESPNSGILAIMDLRQLVGATHCLQTGAGTAEPLLAGDRAGYSAVIVIVEKYKDQAVIHSAEMAGSTGGTIIHARGSSSYHGKDFLSGGVEEEREMVMIIAKDEQVRDLCLRITTDLELNQPGKGILFVTPLYDAAGIQTSQ